MNEILRLRPAAVALDVELARASDEPDHVELHVEATPEIVAAAVELGLEDAGLHEQPEEPAAEIRSGPMTRFAPDHWAVGDV